MSKAMEDLGYLEKGGERVTKPAKTIYIRHCNEIGATGEAGSLGFSCIKQTPDPYVKAFDLSDEKQYKSFHDNWVNGAYLDALKMLNLESNITLPIFDPNALASKIDGLKPPKLGFEETLSLLAAQAALGPPAAAALVLGKCNVKPIDIPTLVPKVLNLVTPPPKITIPIPPVPMPSLDFPDLSLYKIPTYNLLDAKLRIYTAIPKAFQMLIGELANPQFVIDLPTKGPIALLSAACKALNKSMPPQPDESSTSSATYQAAISASLIKPLAAAGMSQTFGSSENGLVGGFSTTLPDSIKTEYIEVSEYKDEGVPSEWTTKTNGNFLVKPVHTPLSLSEAKEAIIKGWKLVFNETPSENTTYTLLAHFAQEAASGEKVYNYNFGGIKRFSSAGRGYKIGTFEYYKPGVKTNITDVFKAYLSPDEGAWDWINLLKSKFSWALQEAKAGHAKQYTYRLGQSKYYTADKDQYSRTTELLFNQFKRKGI